MTIDQYQILGENSIGETDDNGPKVETDSTFTDASVGEGFTHERLPYPRLNRLFHRADHAINRIIRQGTKLAPDSEGADYHAKAFYSKETSFGMAADASNIFEDVHDGVVVTNNIPLSMCYSESDEYGRCLIHGCEGNILGWDIENEVSIGYIVTEAELLAGIPAAMTAPSVIGVCTDNTYVYALIWDSTTTAGRVQSFLIEDGSVNVNWPAEGLALTASAISFSNFEANIVWVAADKLAVSQPWVSVTSGTSAGVMVIDPDDGTSLGTGAGDYGGSSGQCIGICGNGDYVFMAIQETTETAICSMDLTAYGATGCGGTDWPYSVGHWDSGEFSDIKCAGRTVVATGNPSGSGEVLLVVIDEVNGVMTNAYSLSDYVCSGMGKLVYTGLDWWCLGYRDLQKQTFYRLDMVNQTFVNDLTIEDNARLFCDYRRIDGDAVSLTTTLVAFDGRDFWHTGVSTDDLYRLPRINSR